MLSHTLIETKRTLLRPFFESDAEDLFAITGRQDVMRYIAYPHQSIDEAINTINQVFATHYKKYGYGRLAVVDKQGQQLIGFSGLKYLEDIREVDLAYTLHPDFWGKGIATEVADACLSYATENLKIERVIGLTTPNNLASIRVLTKIGLLYEKNRLYWGEEYQQFAWSKNPPSQIKKYQK